MDKFIEVPQLQLSEAEKKRQQELIRTKISEMGILSSSNGGKKDEQKGNKEQNLKISSSTVEYLIQDL